MYEARQHKNSIFHTIFSLRRKGIQQIQFKKDGWKRLNEQNILQRKPDHLFNDIPDAFSNGIPQYYVHKLTPICAILRNIRNNRNYIVDDVYQNGDIDVNSQKYSSALTIFRGMCSSPVIHTRMAKEIVSELFDSSIDSEVENRITNKTQLAIDKRIWLSQSTPTAKALCC